MATENYTLRIKADNLGTVSEVRNFLSDIENAYNGLYTFDFIVEVLSYEYERRRDTRLKLGPRFDDLYYYFGFFETIPNLIELHSRVDVQKIMLPGERLILSKINIQSPGFWEFLGNLNPLQQIREFLKDHHERKKDKKYRNAQEKRKGELDILERENNLINQRIDTLKRLGYSDLEIRQLLNTLVMEPLQKLAMHQNTGLIEGPDDNN